MRISIVNHPKPFLTSKKALSSPQLIPPTDFDLDDDNNNKRYAIKLLNDKRRKVLRKLRTNGLLYRTGNKIFGVDNDTQMIIFYSEFEIKKYARMWYVTTLQQKKLWAKNYYMVEPRLPETVFFNTLLEETNAITSDFQHTYDGRNFWLKHSAIAIERGLYVYYVDLNRTDDAMQLKTKAELKKFSADKRLHGHHMRNNARRLVISKGMIPALAQ